MKYSWPSTSMDFQPQIRKTAQVFLEKNPCISRPAQFKPVLSKGQLYFYFVKIMKFLIMLISSTNLKGRMRCELRKVIFK